MRCNVASDQQRSSAAAFLPLAMQEALLRVDIELPSRQLAIFVVHTAERAALELSQTLLRRWACNTASGSSSSGGQVKKMRLPGCL